MKNMLKKLQKTIAACGIPCAREGAPLGGTLPCLRWRLDMTSPTDGTVTIICWYREDDTGLLDMLDTLAGLFPAGGRQLTFGGGQLLWLRPAAVDCVADETDPAIHGGRMRLTLHTWPGLEVTV